MQPGPPRNRLAKPLPHPWRDHLLTQGVPKRKYVAICRAVLDDGRVLESLIIEQGWIISTSRARLGGTFEERLEFDPRSIATLDVIQTA